MFTESNLAVLAPHLNSLNEIRTERYFFDLMTESMIWEDELVPVHLRATLPVNALRSIFYYRGTLMEGKPDDAHQQYWETAQKLFPHWVGFSFAMRINFALAREELVVRKARIKEWMMDRSRTGGSGNG